MEERDVRKYARQTNFRLIIGVILIIFIVGDGLIFLFYGEYAALMGLICLVAGLTPIIFLLLIFKFFDWIIQRNRENN